MPTGKLLRPLLVLQRCSRKKLTGTAMAPMRKATPPWLNKQQAASWPLLLLTLWCSERGVLWAHHAITSAALAATGSVYH